MFSQRKPYSAVTVAIERLTGGQFEEDDLSGIPELVEVIQLQPSSGPSEAARAIRKKLKYGNVHRQLRALTLLDGLIQNAGSRFQRTFLDEPLLERLRVCGTSALSDAAMRKKCSALFANWAVEYKNTPGLERLTMLHKEMPRRKQTVTQEKSKVIRETEQDPFRDSEDEAEREWPKTQTSPTSPTSSASSSKPPVSFPQPTQKVPSFSHIKSSSRSHSFFSSSKDKKKDKSRKGHRPFNLEAEKEDIKSTIAESSIASTNLTNILQSINRERERISQNSVAINRFEACKRLRRKILRYIYHVEDEQYLGGLLHANDELILALMTFEQLDRSIDADSDSEDELAEKAHIYKMSAEKGKSSTPASPGSPTSEMVGLSIGSLSRSAPPPRPSATSKPHLTPRKMPTPLKEDSQGEESENEADDNPFADRNVMTSSKVE